MRWTVPVALVAVTGLALGSCRAVLGSFELVEGGEGGSGATSGGAGGGGGGSGGSAGHGGAGGQGGQVDLPPNLSCSWIEPIIEVQSLENEIDHEWDKNLLADRGSNSVRVFADRSGSVDVFTIDGANVQSWNFAADWLHQLRRVDGLRLGALVTTAVTGGTGTGNPQLVVRLFDDGDPNGSASTETVLSDPLAFADQLPNTRLRAVFAPVGDGVAGALGTVRFAATFRPTTTDYHGVFGLFDGSTPATPARFTDYLAVDEKEMKPGALLHDGGSNTFYMGEFGQRLYVLGDAPSPSPPDRELIPDEGIFGSLGPNDDGTVKLQLFVISGNGGTVYIGEVPTSTLDSVTTDDLTSVLVITDFDQLLGNGGGGWFGDTLTGAGTRNANEELLGLVITHKLGVMQTNQDLPFPGSSVVQPGGTIIGAIAMPEYEMVSWAGGPVHLAWIAEYDPTPNPIYHVLYYGQVDCSTVDR